MVVARYAVRSEVDSSKRQSQYAAGKEGDSSVRGIRYTRAAKLRMREGGGKGGRNEGRETSWQITCGCTIVHPFIQCNAMQCNTVRSGGTVRRRCNGRCSASAVLACFPVCEAERALCRNERRGDGHEGCWQPVGREGVPVELCVTRRAQGAAAR